MMLIVCKAKFLIHNVLQLFSFWLWLYYFPSTQSSTASLVLSQPALVNPNPQLISHSAESLQKHDNRLLCSPRDTQIWEKPAYTTIQHSSSDWQWQGPWNCMPKCLFSWMHGETYKGMSNLLRIHTYLPYLSMIWLDAYFLNIREQPACFVQRPLSLWGLLAQNLQASLSLTPFVPLIWPRDCLIGLHMSLQPIFWSKFELPCTPPCTAILYCQNALRSQFDSELLAAMCTVQLCVLDTRSPRCLPQASLQVSPLPWIQWLQILVNLRSMIQLQSMQQSTNPSRWPNHLKI